MATLTENPRALSALLSEGPGTISRDIVTIAQAAGVVKANTVLGQITVGLKYVPSPATGADGSETAKAVLAYPVDATDGDVQAVVIRRLAEVKDDELIYAASVDDNTKKAAKHTQLATSLIIVR